MIDDVPHHNGIAWRWVRWLLLLIGIAVSFAACVWMAAVHPKKDVLPFEQNHPQFSSHPMRTLVVAGTLPENLQIQFLAYYATSNPPLGKAGYASCYRSIPLGPTIPLHVSESLQSVRHGSHHEFSVLVDKYEPGYCGWGLAGVTYRVLNSLDDRLHASESGWYGTTIAYFMESPASKGQDDKNKYWRGRVDIWCLNESTARDPRYPESCGVLDGFAHDYIALVPAEERRTNASTAVFPDAQSIEINFHDLNTSITALGENK
jgi:hypothetical protein